MNKIPPVSGCIFINCYHSLAGNFAKQYAKVLPGQLTFLLLEESSYYYHFIYMNP